MPREPHFSDAGPGCDTVPRFFTDYLFRSKTYLRTLEPGAAEIWGLRIVSTVYSRVNHYLTVFKGICRPVQGHIQAAADPRPQSVEATFPLEYTTVSII